MKRKSLMAALLVVLACPYATRADVVKLRNGVQVECKITGVTRDALEVRTDEGMDLLIKQNMVDRIRRDGGMVIVRDHRAAKFVLVYNGQAGYPGMRPRRRGTSRRARRPQGNRARQSIGRSFPNLYLSVASVALGFVAYNQFRVAQDRNGRASSLEVANGITPTSDALRHDAASYRNKGMVVSAGAAIIMALAFKSKPKPRKLAVNYDHLDRLVHLQYNF